MDKKAILGKVDISEKLQILKENNLENYNYIKHIVLEKNKKKRA